LSVRHLHQFFDLGSVLYRTDQYIERILVINIYVLDTATRIKKILKCILPRFHATFTLTCYTRLNVETKVDIYDVNRQSFDGKCLKISSKCSDRDGETWWQWCHEEKV